MAPPDLASMASCSFDCAPADPHPRAPGFVLPPGACDAHFHILGPYSRFALAQGRRFTPPEAPFEAYERLQAAMGLTRGVVVQSGAHGLDLAVTCDALRRAEGRWRGIALYDPAMTRGRIVQLHEAGFRGLRFNLSDGLAGAAALHEASRLIRPFGWNVQILADMDMLPELAPIIRGMAAPCVIDHMGYTAVPEGISHPGFQSLLRLLRSGACWVKVSGADRVGAGSPGLAAAKPFMQALVATNSHRLVWGSDWPHVRSSVVPADGELLDLFAECVPDEVTRHRILVRNPAEFYDFKDNT